MKQATATANANAGVLRVAQDDGVKQATATADSCGMTNQRRRLDSTVLGDRWTVAEQAKATANANAVVLRVAQDDGVKQATATADSCGMTNQEAKAGNDGRWGWPLSL